MLTIEQIDGLKGVTESLRAKYKRIKDMKASGVPHTREIKTVKVKVSVDGQKHELVLEHATIPYLMMLIEKVVGEQLAHMESLPRA